MLRQFVQKLGTVGTGVLITVSSILISVIIRTIISFLSGPTSNLIPNLLITAIIPLIVAPAMSTIFLRLLAQVDKAEQDNAKLVVELQSALATAKTLSGLLPICATCKKIRDDAGYWHQVEVYIHNHAEVDFSHGLCPDCVKDVQDQIAKIKHNRQAPLNE